MYSDTPYARVVGHVEEAAGVAASDAVMEGHDVPPEVMTSVLHWLQKGCVLSGGRCHPPEGLAVFRRRALEGEKYCHNEGCEFVGHIKDFKVCPQCKWTRYCGEACQRHDWTTGGHKAKCGTFATK